MRIETTAPARQPRSTQLPLFPEQINGWNHKQRQQGSGDHAADHRGGDAPGHPRSGLRGVDPAVGRPPEPDEVTSARLWHAWSSRTEADASDLLTPETYLDIHAETGLSLRAIWALTQRWAQYGNLTGQPDEAAAPVGGHE